MLLSQTSLFGLVCSSQNQTDTWEKSYFYLLTGLSLPSHTHTHREREKAGCFYQGCIQKSHSVVPKHMDGRPSTFKSLSATMSSARGSWEVFSYILWPSFCLCSHHWHQNATVYGCPSSVHIYLSRGKKKKKGDWLSQNDSFDVKGKKKPAIEMMEMVPSGLPFCILSPN